VNIKESQSYFLIVAVLFLYYHIALLISSILPTLGIAQVHLALPSLIAILHCIVFFVIPFFKPTLRYTNDGSEQVRVLSFSDLKVQSVVLQSKEQRKMRFPLVLCSLIRNFVPKIVYEDEAI
jgi:hypothetical protein